MNSLAVFEGQSERFMHGDVVGMYLNGTVAYTPDDMPPPLTDPKVNKTKELKEGGGFYLKLSDALPLHREPVDGRDKVCLEVKYNLTELSEQVDASVVITFYNEPLSTLLRSVHSILERTPPPLLREIILVDDFSNATHIMPPAEGMSALQAYVQLLPKVKLLRMSKRNGIVPCRLEGIRAGLAPVIVILDSHIEAGPGWLEPQLRRLQESPHSIVFPQIDSLLSETLDYSSTSGIGCKLSFDWNVQEKPSLTGNINTDAPIVSAMHAGGLLAFRKDYFFEIGGYDEDMRFWGAENVELSLRVWMCGGRLECTPCARVFHIFRKGGVGYSSPPDAVWRNRMRTAKLWMDDYYELALAHNPYHLDHMDADIGPVDKMLDLKERLQCKDFRWFLHNVDPTHEFQEVEGELSGLGELRCAAMPEICVDSLANNKPGSDFGLYGCHGLLGTQGFLLLTKYKQIRLTSKADETNEHLCLAPPNKILRCGENTRTANFSFLRGKADATINGALVRWTDPVTNTETCLEAVKHPLSVTFSSCNPLLQTQHWLWPEYPNVKYRPATELRQRGGGEIMASELRAKEVDVRNNYYKGMCLDTLQHHHVGGGYGVFYCHGMLGTQGFILLKESNQIRVESYPMDSMLPLCLGDTGMFLCEDRHRTAHFRFEDDGYIVWKGESCLTMIELPAGTKSPPMDIAMEPCDRKGTTEMSKAQVWKYTRQNRKEIESKEKEKQKTER